MRNWQKGRLSHVSTKVERTEVNKGNQLLRQKGSRQVKSAQEPLSSYNENAELSDKDIDGLIDEFLDGMESLEMVDVPPKGESSESDQIVVTESYDERYDELVEICQQMEPIHDKIVKIQNEIEHQFNVLKSTVNDIYNPTEDEMSIIQKWRENCRPLHEKQKKLLSEYLVLLDKIDEVVPGAVKPEPSSDNATTMIYIDYEYIKLMLGPLPEGMDSYLSQFFSKTNVVIFRYETTKRYKEKTNHKDFINKL